MERALLAIGVVMAASLAAAAYAIAAERLVGLFPNRHQPLVRPWLWLAPTLVLLLAFLVYPAIQTLYLSFQNANSTRPVGLANYQFVLTDQTMLVAVRNNLIWVVVFTTLTVGTGLIVAALADRVRYESVIKAVIFLPMAISFVAAGVIWKFMYDFRPPVLPQTGTLNAALMALIPGFEPQAWLVNNPPFNNLALIAAAAWTWTGFCMVVLSAAIKGVPAELLDAARVDGASEFQVFRHVTLPTIAPTLGVVSTTMVIFALKAFDIVYVMTNGNFETEVIANRMYKEMFNVRDFGRAAALAVMLLAAVVPIMLINIRRFRQQEEGR